MSRIGEFVLRNIWKAYHRTTVPVPPEPRLMAHENYIRWQFSTSKKLFSYYPDFDPRGKTILEIGCGTGGRTAWLATTGARRVVGIDINAPEIAIANELCPTLFPESKGIAEYLASSENDLLPLGEFDLVLLVDAMEHVVSPPSMMRLAHHYTAPGGRFYFSTIGWYHHAGSHTRIVPFANLFFSDETLINVTRWIVSRPGYQPTSFDSDPPTKRWEGLYNLRDRPGEHLNKITISELKKLLRHSIFPHNRMEIVGFHNLASLFNPLRKIPGLQEIFHSYIVVECRK